MRNVDLLCYNFNMISNAFIKYEMLNHVSMTTALQYSFRHGVNGDAKDLKVNPSFENMGSIQIYGVYSDSVFGLEFKPLNISLPFSYI